MILKKGDIFMLNLKKAALYSFAGLLSIVSVHLSFCYQHNFVNSTPFPIKVHFYETGFHEDGGDVDPYSKAYIDTGGWCAWNIIVSSEVTIARDKTTGTLYRLRNASANIERGGQPCQGGYYTVGLKDVPNSEPQEILYKGQKATAFPVDLTLK